MLFLVACCACCSLCMPAATVGVPYKLSMQRAEICVAAEGAHFGIFTFHIGLISLRLALWLVQGTTSEATLRKLATTLPQWSQGFLWCHIKSQR